MSRRAFYAVCVASFTLPVAGLCLAIGSLLDMGRLLPEAVHPYAILGSALGVSMILGGFTAR